MTAGGGAADGGAADAGARGRGAAWREAAALAGILAFVVLVQSLPHLPGEPSPGPLRAYPELAERAADGLRGGGDPHPLHVDEHIHMAWQGEMGRTGSVAIDDPYTGRPYGFDLFSLQGLRQERGFDTAVLQVHQLTGVPLPALARFLPALWSGVVAAGLWAVLRPAPGALAAAAAVAAVPTTVRMLGPAFLVPSAFGLAWLPLTLAVALKADGGRRFAGMLLAVTGATFQHLVLGTLCMAIGILATLLRPGPRGDRLALLVATFLPLLWILPVLWGDVVSAIQRTHELPFEQRTFLWAGLPFYALAALGAAAAWSRRDDARLPHRVLALLLVGIVASLAWSIENDHRSDATYSRLVPTFFVCAGALAGLAVGEAAAWLRILLAHAVARPAGPPAPPADAPAALPPPRPPPAPRTARLAAGSLAFLLAAVVLAPAVDGNLHDQFYHVFDATAWRDVEVLAQEAGPDDVLLMHPWQAPVANALTGARPHAVLYPGRPALQSEDWNAYLDGAANATWLEERGITVVAGPRVPDAPHEPIDGQVYRIVRP